MAKRDIYAIAGMDENHFLKENETLIHSVMKTLPLERIKAETGLEREDLFSVGQMAMIKAKRKFNSDFGFQFSTYAVPIIRGEIMRHTLLNGKIHVSRPIREAYAKIVKAGLLAADDEVVADTLEMTVKQVRKAKLVQFDISSLDLPINEEAGDAVVGDLLTDNVSAEDVAEGNLTIREFLSTLTPQEQYVWSVYSETNCGSQADVSKIVGTSQAQVSRTLKKIFSKATAFGQELMANI